MEDDRYIVDWKENLFSAYCDILETSGEFLKSSLDIDLGSIIDGIDRIEHFEEIVGEDRIEENKLIFSPYKNVREAVSEIRGKYYSYFSSRSLEWFYWFFAFFNWRFNCAYSGLDCGYCCGSFNFTDFKGFSPRQRL